MSCFSSKVRGEPAKSALAAVFATMTGRFRSKRTLPFYAFLSCASIIVAQPAAPSLTEAESRAITEIKAQATAGLITVQPWVQVLGGNRLGVAWLTSEPADGIVEWTQDETAGSWRQAWFSEDGLRQANSTIQRAVIEGYDPAKPIRFRARSRPITSFRPYKVTFGPAAVSEVRTLPARSRTDGVSFAVFNDIHNRVQFYPLLTGKAGPQIDFAVFNGDVLADPQDEREAVDYLLKPMAWFASRSIPCFALRGNHETRGAFARHLKDYLILPEKQYYAAMTFGAARVIFLDTGEDKPDSSVEYSGLVDFEPYIAQEAEWLKQEIASPEFQQARWRIVIMHIPPDWRKPVAEMWHGPRRVHEKFVPLLDAGKVTVVISGHTHRPEIIEPCPDKNRGFQWPVFIGGAPRLDQATLIRVDADAKSLRIRRFHTDGSVQAERTW